MREWAEKQMDAYESGSSQGWFFWTLRVLLAVAPLVHAHTRLLFFSLLISSWLLSDWNRSSVGLSSGSEGSSLTLDPSYSDREHASKRYIWSYRNFRRAGFHRISTHARTSAGWIPADGWLRHFRICLLISSRLSVPCSSSYRSINLFYVLIDLSQKDEAV